MKFMWFIYGLISGFILVKLFWYCLTRWKQKRARREQKRIQFLRCKKLIREKMVRIGPDPDDNRFIKLLEEGRLNSNSAQEHDDAVFALADAVRIAQIRLK